jgi:signal peptidase I
LTDQENQAIELVHGLDQSEAAPRSFPGERERPPEVDAKIEAVGGTAEATAPTESGRSGLKGFLFDILETLLLTIVIYAVLSTFIGRYKVLSISMEPTLHEGQYLLISKQTHRVWPLERGDIIVFKYPNNPEKFYIKRLIGLPGENVELRRGKLYVDGELTPEPWLPQDLHWTSSGQWTLAEDEYLVMGDNRNNSSDSRRWGPITKSHFIGQAFFRYWPIPDLGLVRRAPTPTPTPRTVRPFESLLNSPLPASATP